MSTVEEQARAEAEKRILTLEPGLNDLTVGLAQATRGARRAFIDGFIAGHKAATRTREVTTASELDALLVGSVVLNDVGVAWQKRGVNDRWYCAGPPSGIKLVPYLPARVLHTPEVAP